MRPTLWFDGPSYRLLEVNTLLDPYSLRLVFSEASYFNGVNTAEPLSYELALRHNASPAEPMAGAVPKVAGRSVRHEAPVRASWREHVNPARRAVANHLLPAYPQPETGGRHEHRACRAGR